MLLGKKIFESILKMKVASNKIYSRYFKVNDCVFSYLKNQPNSERTVEVPLGEFFINNFGYGITEINVVMATYGFNCGECLTTQDALVQDLSNKNILSIGNTNPDLVKKIVSQAKNYLVTWAIGFYSELDRFAKESSIQKFTMKRISENNKWIKESEINFEHKYNEPYEYGNGICCITNLEVLL
jgi:hypothetical protein